MQVERSMEYAIRLADSEFRGEFEDIFKLASLVDEIAKHQKQEAVSSSDLEHQFRTAMKAAYRTNGRFRQEVERFPDAKRLITGM